MLVFLLLQSTGIHVLAITLNRLAASTPSDAISLKANESYTKEVTSGEEIWFKIDPSEIVNSKTHIRFEVVGISYYLSIYNNIDNANNDKTHSNYLNKSSYISYPIAWVGPYYVKIKAASSGNMTLSIATEKIATRVANTERVEINAASIQNTGDTCPFLEVLSKTDLGKEITNIYYSTSSSILDEVAFNKRFRDKITKEISGISSLLVELESISEKGTSDSILSKNEYNAIFNIYKLVSSEVDEKLKSRIDQIWNTINLEEYVGINLAKLMRDSGISDLKGSKFDILVDTKNTLTLDEVNIIINNLFSENGLNYTSSARNLGDAKVNIDNSYVVTVNDCLDNDKPIEIIKKSPQFKNVSSNTSAYSLSSDIQYNSQWNLQNVEQKVPTRTASGIVNVVGKKYSDIDYINLYSVKNNIVLPKTLIAVVDTGVNYELADLKDVVQVSDGYDFVNNDNDAMDDNNHGTHIAGIIAAKDNNGYSISGINKLANILPIKVLDSNGSGTVENIAKGIKYAVDKGAKVINLSLGIRNKDGSQVFPEEVPQIETQIKYAYDKGVTVIVAAGNEAKGNLSYPANSNYVLSVGAIDNNDELASFTNWGPGLDMVAPGVSIPSLLTNGEVAYFSGTSMSAPHVSAVVGLLYSINTNITTIDVKDILHNTSADLGETGYDTKFGYGRLSSAKAARMAESSNPKVQRLSGINRIETSIAIAKDQYTNKAPDAIVLATSNNFADALAGSGLAYNYNAPLLLVNKTVKDSKNVLDYIEEKLSKNKKIYILGGSGAVSNEISDYLTTIGYKIIRLGGKNRYDTNQKIVDNLNILKGTSIVITTGSDFADALSISSIAGIKGYPILLNGKENLLQNVSSYITKTQPTTIYMIGGTGVLSDSTYKQIKKINPTIDVVRLGGKNRYETSINIIEHFNLTTNSVTVATGKNFPDALSGSVLAARKNCGVLLVDNKDVNKQIDLLSKKKITNIIVFGGQGIISDNIANSLVR